MPHGEVENAQEWASGDMGSHFGSMTSFVPCVLIGSLSLSFWIYKMEITNLAGQVNIKVEHPNPTEELVLAQ